ncbi:uncharacterized protein DSM5745_09443 [Aspergillus mulundensis]|uniref:C6 transcription factor n=1 Tax=Aspergillus mulundensis TaxID=1810919 RepID=A0A3D8QW13_9EURO|nr:hypothetical protein DSM5745_09443 [Aspergillus mulundensis]RDW65704.1 hypothetical protein DSM5745_09443 [Aspergillus mulundensis]
MTYAGEQCLRFALQDPRVQNLDKLSRYYIDYYSQRICKLYILHDSSSNPFRSLLPYALEDLPLLKSISALAARHFANTGYLFDTTVVDSSAHASAKSANANFDALRFKSQAIAALAESLRADTPKSNVKDTTMATILLLIFLELLESGLDGWDVHLEGARSLVQFCQSLSRSSAGKKRGSEMGEALRAFIDRQIETLGAALSSPDSPFMGPDSAGYQCGGNDGRESESIIRSFLGCPEFLLRSIHFFSNQRHLIAEANLALYNDDVVSDRIQDTVAMLELTQTFDSFAWASGFLQCQSSGSSGCPAEIQNLCMLSEAYKTATLLYGRQVIGPLSPATENTESELVLQLLNLINALRDQETLFKCLLWPTFIAGLHLHYLQVERERHHQQMFVLDSLRRLWDLTSCLNVMTATNILKGNWRQSALGFAETQNTLQGVVLDRHWLLI